MNGYHDMRYGAIAQRIALALEDLIAMVEKQTVSAVASHVEEMTEIKREIAETRRAMDALMERLASIDQLLAEIVRLQSLLDDDARRNGTK